MFIQTIISLEESPFGLTITEDSPCLWIESGNKRKELFDTAAEAERLVQAYGQMLLDSADSFHSDDLDEQRYFSEMFVTKGMEEFMRDNYGVKYKFEGNGFEEFEEHIIGRLMNIEEPQELKQAA